MWANYSLVVQAVAAGRITETIWTRGTKTVKSIGKLFIDNGPPLTLKSSTLTNPFVSLRKKEYEYLSYKP